ncbi:MAG: hypothetical protein F6K08_14295 [Okeania sp. SIO1H6]|nr:hypothetical protein [Okeania sp. SIO1H6]
MKISLENSSVGNLCFSQSKSKAKIRALVDKKIGFVKLISYRKKVNSKNKKIKLIIKIIWV